MHQGCAASIKKNTYDSVTINNGSQGMKRIDLIVARYEKQPETNVESLTLKVLQGTPAETSPQVPAHTEGDIQAGDTVADMPLYEVEIDGLNITEIRKVFQTMGDLESLNGKMENFEVDTMEELTKSYGFTVLFKQIGALKIIRIAGNPNGQLTTHNISLPEKARARYYYSTPTRVGSKWGEVKINGTSCSIKMDTPIDASAYVNIWSVYI